MKLVRFGSKGFELPGLLQENGDIRDLSGHIKDIAGPYLDTLSLIEKIEPERLPIGGSLHDDIRLGQVITQVGKVVAVGLNYRNHAKECGLTAPDEPILFMKASSSLTGPFDPVKLPAHALRADWEVELAVVIGKPGVYIEEKQALNYVAGFTLMNDLSERAFQLERGGQWVKGKSLDGFGPIGPYLATPSEIEDPQNLSLWLDVNGVRKQTGHTSDMIFSVAYIIHYVSQFMSLQPGDVITTGTPAGVGMGLDPQEYLRKGDILTLGIDGLGEQKTEMT